MPDLNAIVEDVLISAALAAFARGEHVEVCRAVIQALPPERRLALWPERRRSRTFASIAGEVDRLGRAFDLSLSPSRIAIGAKGRS